MKKLLLGGLLLLSVVGYTQPRVNEVLPKFIETGNSFTETTQYEYSSYTGSWKEIKNDNQFFFKKIEFKTIEFNSEKFYVMVIHEVDGAYEYPSIKQGFYIWNSLRGYIYTAEQYQRLKEYQTIISNYNEVRASDISNDGMLDLELKVINTLKEKSKPYYKPSFKIKKEDDNTIRFILPLKREYSSSESYYGFDKKYFESKITDFDKLFSL